MRLNFNGFLNAETLLVLNGAFPEKLPDIQGFKKIFCTDGALNGLLARNYIPDGVIGDMDSITEIPKGIEIIHRPNQNKTDFQKALEYLRDEDFSSVLVMGGEAQEEDHFLGNLDAALQMNHDLEIRFASDLQFYFLAQTETAIQGLSNQIISLFPFPWAQAVETRGLEFALNNEDLSIGKRIGIRNRAIETEVKITFEKGDLWVFVNRD